MIGLEANGMNRAGAQKVMRSPNVLGFLNDSVTRGGFIKGE